MPKSKSLKRDKPVTSSLKSALNRAPASDKDGAASAAGSTDGPDFIASKKWQGAKPGYFFGTNNRKTGYYKDVNDPSAASTQAGGASKKRSVQIMEDQNELHLIPRKPLTGKELLEQAEKENASSVVLDLTPKGLRSATNALVKLSNKNIQQRSQYADEPKMYMESELNLYDHITSLKAVAAANAQLYQSISTNEKLLSTLLQLLGHDNTDIASSVTSLLLEWLDPALLTTFEEAGADRSVILNVLSTLCKRVLEDSWETIVINLQRFDKPISPSSSSDGGDGDEDGKGKKSSTDDDDDDAEDDDEDLDGISNVLSLIENLLDIDMIIPEGIFADDDDDDDDNNNTSKSAAAFMVKESKTLLSWLIQKLDIPPKRAITESTMRYMEITTILSQRQDVHAVVADWSKLPKSNRSPDVHVIPHERPGKKVRIAKEDAEDAESAFVNGIEIMLQAIGRFRKNQPSNEDEIDYLENVCTTLCCCLSFSKTNDNMEAFLEGQGIELIVKCLKERTHAGGCGLKLLDFFGSSDVHQKACEHLVVAGGLKYVFPLFMATRAPKQALESKKSKAKRSWLHMLQTQIVRVMYALTRHLTEDSPQDAQSRFVAKFVDDKNKCDQLVDLLITYDQKARKAEYDFYRSDVEEDMAEQSILELAALEAKLKGGGEIFHRLGAIAAFLCVHSKRCHENIVSQLRLQQSGISIIKAALEEFISVISDGVQQKKQLKSYLDQL